ncbi:YggS family pyridoxal phosphate-dependent enzyme [Chlorogloeopsis sp. ULAP02]|uniref:YggS family pyridoxal phosphate-dependent enzyme n=1 Tax=Chlorogloeopsis sp. ULAP02 TaxID=3107926 RepID=UPI003136FAF2
MKTSYHISTSKQVATNLQSVRVKVSQAAQAVNRASGSVSLIAVSKTHGCDTVRAVLDEGQRIFGESRVQEATSKWSELKGEYPDIELHLIGPLQTNKVRKAVALFNVIQTLDSLKLAESLSKEMKQQGRFPKCFVQVNTGEEAQKAGVTPWEANRFIDTCIEDFQLPVFGVMCIPPADLDPAPHFNLLREIAERHQLPAISMGMSRDYELAISCGATHVRVGTAIFGHRVV